MRKLTNIICLVLISVFIFTPMLYAEDTIAYDLKNGYIAVKEEVFNSLVTGDKLNSVYVIEIDRQNGVILSLNNEFNNKDKVNTERIATLSSIIEADKAIILAQQNSFENYEAMFKAKTKENTRLKTQVVLYKVLMLGIGIAAITQIDSVGWKVAAGAGLASLTVFEWRF